MARKDNNYANSGVSFENAASTKEKKKQTEKEAGNVTTATEEKVFKAFNIEEDLAKIVDKLGKQLDKKQGGRGGKSKLVNQVLESKIIKEDFDLENLSKEQDVFDILEENNKVSIVKRGFKIEYEVARKLDYLAKEVGRRGAHSDIVNEALRQRLSEKGYL